MNAQAFAFACLFISTLGTCECMWLVLDISICICMVYMHVYVYILCIQSHAHTHILWRSQVCMSYEIGAIKTTHIHRARSLRALMQVLVKYSPKSLESLCAAVAYRFVTFPCGEEWSSCATHTQTYTHVHTHTSANSDNVFFPVRFQLLFWWLPTCGRLPKSYIIMDS